MKIQRFVVFLFLFALCSASAFARKPAVEDFVGVEPESYSRTPQGTETLFEFGNTVKAFNPETSSFWTEWTPAFVLTSFFLLPFIMWFGITKSADSVQRTIEESENVKRLSDYKKDLDKGKNKDEEAYKEAS
ncbi:MAG: hypothetical protein WEB87_02425 [Bacteriovoracaceae bacterium]